MSTELLPAWRRMGSPIAPTKAQYGNAVRGHSCAKSLTIGTPRRRGRCAIGGLMKASRLLPFLAALVAVATVAEGRAESVALKIETERSGAKIDRHIFGQFAEHLGRGIYEGIWVGPESPIPNTRGIRNDVVAALKALQRAQRALARRLLRGRISLAQRHRPARSPRHAQSQLGRRHRAEYLRHARVHGLRAADRRARPIFRSTWAPARRRKPPTGSST